MMSPNDTTGALEDDEPVELPEEDTLSRTEFCKALAKTLANSKGRAGLAIGITGEWGTGKSTIKNFVKHYLEVEAKDPKPVVIEFNPWEWSGQGKLLEAFLGSLSEALGKPNVSKKHRKLGKRLKRYSAALQVGGAITSVLSKVIFAVGVIALSLGVWSGLGAESLIVILGAVVLVFVALPSVFDKLAKFIDAHLDASEKSIDDLREAIGKDLLAIKSPIIVFIDDVDRLSKEEIKLLFQLVRMNLRFSNLTFVLLFQRDIVASALDELTAGNGSDYIGKIIQVEFDVPKASTEDMQKSLLERLDKVISDGRVAPSFDRNRWMDLFNRHLRYYFRNLRDIKRFSSSLEFYYRRHLNEGILEVDAVDLIAVEVLRVFDNEAFRKLARSLFRDRRNPGESEEERFNRQFEEIAAHLKEADQRERLKELLHALFPQASGSSANREWHRRSRICDEDSFPRYFELILDPSQATRRDLLSILSNAGDRARSVELLRSAIENNTIDSLLYLILCECGEIPPDSKATFVTALFDVGDEFPEEGSIVREITCREIIYGLVKGEDRDKILSKAYKDTTGFFLPIHLANASLKDAGPGRLQMTKEELKPFYDINLSRIREKANNGSLLEQECGYVLYPWAEWGKENEARHWVEKTAQDPMKALKLSIRLYAHCQNSIIEGKLSPSDAEWIDDKLIDIKVLLESAQKVPEKDRPERSAEALKFLNAAVEEKEG